MAKTKKQRSIVVKATPAILKAFGLEGLKKEKLCLYVDVYDEDGNVIRSGCLDTGCYKAGGECEPVGGKKCKCRVIT